jgi:hypothetical protein
VKALDIKVLSHCHETSIFMVLVADSFSLQNNASFMICTIDKSRSALNSIVTNQDAEATALILEISGYNIKEARGMTTASSTLWGRGRPYL